MRGLLEVFPAYFQVAKWIHKDTFRVSKRLANRNDVFIKLETWYINHVVVKFSDISSLSIE